MATPSLSRFLRLPFEIREMIYKLCCADSETDRSFDLSKWNQKAKYSRELKIVCSQPYFHLGLSQVNKQIRDEYFPIFAAHHTFNFSNPLELADYLSYTPPYRLRQLRHITLIWIRCVKVDPSSDMRDPAKVPEIYPEPVSNPQSTTFRPSSKVNTRNSSDDDSPEGILVRSVPQLLAALDSVLKRQSLARRHFIVTPCWYPFHFQVIIFAVSQATWDGVDDNQQVIGNCNSCKKSHKGRFMKSSKINPPEGSFTTPPIASSLLNSVSEWKDGLAIVRHAGTAHSSCGVADKAAHRIAGGEPKWKVIFHSLKARPLWNRYMREYRLDGVETPSP